MEKIKFKIDGIEKIIIIETNEVELLYGATFIVLPLNNEIFNSSEEAFTGAYAIHPLNNKLLPIYVSDYVIISHIGIPAHNEDDYNFANKYNIEIIQVLAKVFEAAKDKEDAIRPDKPFTDRLTVQMVIKHPTEEKTLCVKYNKFGWITLPMGGIEDGEDLIQSGIRELEEETGYYDVNIERILPNIYFDNFYAAHKEVNRHVTSYTVIGKLNSLDIKAMSEEEKNIQLPMWVENQDLINTITIQAHRFIAENYLENKYTYNNDGIMINSAFLNDLTREAAREKMKKYLKESCEF